jgi:hypothetical protein
MIGNTAGSHFSSVSSSCPAIRSASCQFCQNVAPWALIWSSGIGKNHRWLGPVNREGVGWLSSMYKPKTSAQRETREPELCHDSGPRSRCATCLEVGAGCFPSFASERRKRMFHLPSVPVEQISYTRCIQYQTFVTFSFVVPVEVRPERSSPSTDILPSWNA